ncbi:hypothetical protein LCGC14_1202800 [marine sediment metagenome]|uniref:Uncharacterized protein n=1 Tax=marine sediment metagenome TaxID=412755 RepID=A0A0F9PL46_9ZZZZ
MAGNKNSGRRRKSLSKEDSERSMTLLCPGAVKVMEATMNGSNRDKLKYEAAKGIYEHVMGKAKQSIDQTIKGEVLVTHEMRSIAAREMLEVKEAEYELLKEGDNAVTGRSQEGVSKGLDEEAEV